MQLSEQVLSSLNGLCHRALYSLPAKFLAEVAREVGDPDLAKQQT